jgi:hypothetical protein
MQILSVLSFCVIALAKCVLFSLHCGITSSLLNILNPFNNSGRKGKPPLVSYKTTRCPFGPACFSGSENQTLPDKEPEGWRFDTTLTSTGRRTRKEVLEAPFSKCQNRDRNIVPTVKRPSLRALFTG